jgi:hypothetical protein
VRLLCGMTSFPAFQPRMYRNGRWFVSVVTGCGPDSHVGEFATEREAQSWILTKSKDWGGGVRVSPPLTDIAAETSDRRSRPESPA